MIKPQYYWCPHGHTGQQHPACYRKYVSGEDKVAYIDIETSNLNSDFGVIYTYVIKDSDGNIISGKLRKSDFNNHYIDKRLVKELVEHLKNYTTVVGYYSTNFDMPWIRSHAMKYNIPFPEYGTMRHIDLYYVVKYKMKLSRNRLENATKFLGIKGKSHINPDYWIHAAAGDERSINKILEHNKWDVIILEKLHKRLMPYMSNTKKSI